MPSAQASAFLARTSGLNQKESQAFIYLINTLVTAGLWTMFDLLYVLATNSEANAQLNLINTSFTLTKHGSLTFTSDVGYTGDGATGYLDSGYNSSGGSNTNYLLNSGSLGAYIQTVKTAADGSVIFGGGSPTSFSYLSPNNTGQVFNFDVNDFNFPSFSTATGTGSQGAWISSRTNSTTLNMYKNGSATSVASSSSANSSLAPSFYLFCLYDSSVGGPDHFSPLQASIFFVSAGLTGAQAVTINNTFNTFMSRISGSNVY